MAITYQNNVISETILNMLQNSATLWKPEEMSEDEKAQVRDAVQMLQSLVGLDCPEPVVCPFVDPRDCAIYQDDNDMTSLYSVEVVKSEELETPANSGLVLRRQDYVPYWYSEMNTTEQNQSAHIKNIENQLRSFLEAAELEKLAAHNCRIELIESFNRAFVFELPLSGRQKHYFPDSSANYISPPEEGCIQTFTFWMADGSPNPSELSLNMETGVFTLEIDSAIKRTYNVEIDVRINQKGVNPDRHIDTTLRGISIDVICGQDSTVLTAPRLPGV